MVIQVNGPPGSMLCVRGTEMWVRGDASEDIPGLGHVGVRMKVFMDITHLGEGKDPYRLSKGLGLQLRLQLHLRLRLRLWLCTELRLWLWLWLRLQLGLRALSATEGLGLGNDNFWPGRVRVWVRVRVRVRVSAEHGVRDHSIPWSRA